VQESLPRPRTNETPALEEMGLNLRPELREAAYQERIDRQDIYKEMIKMMPGIGILGSLNYDSNHLAYYNTWGEFGMRATYNLVSLIEGPRAIAAARSSVEVAKARRMALGVAVLTQVNLGYQEYLSALEDLASANELDHVQRELSNTALSSEEAEAQPEAVRVRRALQAMAADFELGRARSAAYAALANLYIATGVDLVPADVDVNNLPKLADEVNVSIQPWEQGKLPEMPASAVVPPPAPGAKSGS
jgi:outer membrane protein TolC